MKFNVDAYTEGVERSSLPYWYHKIKKHCPSILMPRTLILPVSQVALTPFLDGEITPEIRAIVKKAKKKAQTIGYPLFLRTDQASGKHNWNRSCFVPDEKSLPSHIQQVVEANELAGIFGLPYKSLIFRKLLNLEAKFTAFWGEMPVAKERRYYVNDGDVLCHHPYWPPESIENPSIDEWEPVLEELNKEAPDEIQYLTTITQLVGAVLNGYWSVDFACTEKGRWYLIDMADGYISYHWDDCQHQLHPKQEGD